MKLIFTFFVICSLGGCRQERSVDLMWNGDSYGLAAALIAYRSMTGVYPTSDQGFAALLKRPDDLPQEVNWKQIIIRIPTDRWGHEYQYSPPTNGDPPTFEVRSLGRDGVPSVDDLVAKFRADTEEIKQIREAEQIAPRNR